MIEEESESNTPETPEIPEQGTPETPETPPAPSGEEPGSPDTPQEPSDPPKKEVVLSEEEHASLLKAQEDRDKYRDDLIALKKGKRKDELFEDLPREESPEAPTPNPGVYISDYLSKRKDIMDEFAGALGGLPDAAFATLQASLRAEETHLRRTMTDYVSRVRIKKMFEDALNYVRFKHNLERPATPEEQIDDFGSTRTIRKPLGINKRKISDRAYAIAKESQTKDGGLSPEQVQDQLDRGQIK